MPWCELNNGMPLVGYTPLAYTSHANGERHRQTDRALFCLHIFPLLNLFYYVSVCVFRFRICHSLQLTKFMFGLLFCPSPRERMVFFVCERTLFVYICFKSWPNVILILWFSHLYIYVRAIATMNYNNSIEWEEERTRERERKRANKRERMARTHTVERKQKSGSTSKLINLIWNELLQKFACTRTSHTHTACLFTWDKLEQARRNEYEQLLWGENYLIYGSEIGR